MLGDERASLKLFLVWLQCQGCARGFQDKETGDARANVQSPHLRLLYLVTIGPLATHQILSKLVNRILRYGAGGGGGARAHVQRCPTPPMTCGKHVLSDPQPTYQI